MNCGKRSAIRSGQVKPRRPRVMAEIISNTQMRRTKTISVLLKIKLLFRHLFRQYEYTTYHLHTHYASHCPSQERKRWNQIFSSGINSSKHIPAFSRRVFWVCGRFIRRMRGSATWGTYLAVSPPNRREISPSAHVALLQTDKCSGSILSAMQATTSSTKMKIHAKKHRETKLLLTKVRFFRIERRSS